MHTSTFLVTFCNQDLYTPVEANLLLIDVARGRQQWILTGNQYGITGIGINDDYLFVLHQGPQPGVVVLTKNDFTIVASVALTELADPHSMVVRENTLIVVSTGTDSVLEYQFDPVKRTIRYIQRLWKPQDSSGDRDQYHINSLTKHGEDFFVSAFGPKNGDTWKTAQHGFVYNITTQQPVDGFNDIYHPHSLTIDGADIYFCESTAREVQKNNEIILTLPHGYTRGLAVTDEYIVVGSSQGRKISKSTGQVNNFFDQEGDIDAVCAINVFDKHAVKPLYEYTFFPDHREIYEIIPVEHIGEAAMPFYGVHNVVDTVVKFKHIIEQNADTIKERDVMIESGQKERMALSQHVQAIDHELQNQSVMIKQKDSEIVQKDSKIVQKDNEITYQKEIIALMKTRQDELDERIQKESTKVVACQDQLEQAYAVIHQKDQELLMVQESKFWKLRGTYMRWKRFFFRR